MNGVVGAALPSSPGENPSRIAGNERWEAH
jgi:hypothetical protein